MVIFKPFTKMITTAALLLLPVASSADDWIERDKHDMMADLDTIKELFSARYAPVFWKNSYAGWDIQTEVDGLKDRITSRGEGVPVSLKEYQRMVRDLLLSTKDYHVGVQFWSTESAKLPFSVRSAEGRFFLTHIDRSEASVMTFPFFEGDEVITFDGRPISVVVEEFRINEIGEASPLTDQALAEMLLTRRTGMMAHNVPRGPVTVGLVDSFGMSRNVQLLWDHTKEKIKPWRPDPNSPQGEQGSIFMDEAEVQKLWLAQHPDAKEPQGDPQLRGNHLFQLEMTTPMMKTLDKAFGKQVDNRFALGARRSMLPMLGDAWWESGFFNPFHAYIYTLEDGRNVGYVRVPHYSAGSFHSMFFADVIRAMEEKTDGLVIDQLNNPGGSVLYLYSLVAMLTDQPMVVPTHRMAMTQEDLYGAHEIVEALSQIQTDEQARYMLGPDLGGYPVSLQFVRSFLEYAQFIIDEWEDGRRFTDPAHLLGVHSINPHADVNYTKPILVLVNELDFSGGDFFPAILQDNQRVTVMGTKTSGAGGCVEAFSFPNRFGIAGMRNTVSLAERIDGKPIENLGVTPDIEYQPSMRDMQNGFEEMAEAVNNTIAGMMPPPEPSGPCPMDDGGDDVDDGDDGDDWIGRDDWLPDWVDDWGV